MWEANKYLKTRNSNGNFDIWKKYLILLNTSSCFEYRKYDFNHLLGNKQYKEEREKKKENWFDSCLTTYQFIIYNRVNSHVMVHSTGSWKLATTWNNHIAILSPNRAILLVFIINNFTRRKGELGLLFGSGNSEPLVVRRWHCISKKKFFKLHKKYVHIKNITNSIERQVLLERARHVRKTPRWHGWKKFCWDCWGRWQCEVTFKSCVCPAHTDM